MLLKFDNITGRLYTEFLPSGMRSRICMGFQRARWSSSYSKRSIRQNDFVFASKIRWNVLNSIYQVMKLDNSFLNLHVARSGHGKGTALVYGIVELEAPFLLLKSDIHVNEFTTKFQARRRTCRIYIAL